MEKKSKTKHSSEKSQKKSKKSTTQVQEVSDEDEPKCTELHKQVEDQHLPKSNAGPESNAQPESNTCPQIQLVLKVQPWPLLPLLLQRSSTCPKVKS